MPTLKQTKTGKIQACIVIDEKLKEVVSTRAEELNMSASDVYMQGALTFLNNGNRPISKEEVMAREMFANMPEENVVYLRATADFLKGSVDQAKYGMLRTLLGKFLSARMVQEKNGRSLQMVSAA